MIGRDSDSESRDSSQSKHKLVVRSAERSALEASNIMRSFLDRRQRRGQYDFENAAKIDAALDHNLKVMAGDSIDCNPVEQLDALEEYPQDIVEDPSSKEQSLQSLPHDDDKWEDE